MATTGSAELIVRRVWADLGRDPGELEGLESAAAGTPGERVPGTRVPTVPLPSRLDVSGLAAGAVAAASLAAASAGGACSWASLRIEGDRIATAFTSERWFRRGGAAPDVWAPLSGFRRAADGWVRTHANYPHHAAALRRALGLGDDADAGRVDAAIAGLPADDVETRITSAGGVCSVVRAENPEHDARLRRGPLVELVPSPSDGGPARAPHEVEDPARPVHGIRVLDLTRVIAGPVGTRALALLGADVLRVDSPQLPEPEWQHLDTGAGKRSTLLDLATRADRRRFDELLSSADVVVLGYRPAGLAALGLDPEELVGRHGGLVVAQLAAWGFGEADGRRRGFDSIVQAASGIARIEGSRDDDGGLRPGALPAQALDHASGYLLAAGVLSMLTRASGEARVARLSLRRTAAELLGLPRTAEPMPADRLSEARADRHLENFVIGAERVRVTAPAIAYEGGPVEWPSGPRAWGGDAPAWPGVPGDTPGM